MEETLQYQEFRLQQLEVVVALDRLPNTIHVYQAVQVVLEVADPDGIHVHHLGTVLAQLAKETEEELDTQLEPLEVPMPVVAAAERVQLAAQAPQRVLITLLV
jgi:hypothetical protein